MKIKGYEYGVHIWGGFFNELNPYKHDIKRGSHYFDTEQERDDFIKLLRKHETEGRKVYRLSTIATHKTEGVGIRNHSCCHRIVEYKGVHYYSKNQWSWVEDVEALKYHMEWKWYPGFNDDVVEETLKEDVDYKEVTIVEEWVTGTVFTYKNNEE